MPRVLRIINRLNLGGPTYNAAYLSKYLAPEFETLLVAGIKEDTEESSEFIVTQMGLEPVYIPEMRRAINFKNDKAAYKKIVELIKQFKPDIVHTHAAKAGTLGRLAARNQGVPIIIHTFHGHVFHSYFHPVKTWVFKNIERYLSSISTKIIAISDIQQKELVTQHRVAKASQTEVIPLGFDLDRFMDGQALKRLAFREQYGIKEDEIAVGIIGRLVSIKNHDMFLKVMQRVLQSTDKKVKALIIGDGEDRDLLIRTAQTLGLKVAIPGISEPNANVIFTSWILEIDIALAGLDIVAMTSLNEGTPVSLIEAQAAGKPIVSTEVGGISNVVLPGASAFLAASGDVNGFADHLLHLVENDELRHKMSGVAVDHVKMKFSYQRLVADMRQLYRSLLQQVN